MDLIEAIKYKLKKFKSYSGYTSAGYYDSGGYSDYTNYQDYYDSKVVNPKQATRKLSRDLFLSNKDKHESDGASFVGGDANGNMVCSFTCSMCYMGYVSVLVNAPCTVFLVKEKSNITATMGNLIICVNCNYDLDIPEWISEEIVGYIR